MYQSKRHHGKIAVIAAASVWILLSGAGAAYGQAPVTELVTPNETMLEPGGISPQFEWMSVSGADFYRVMVVGVDTAYSKLSGYRLARELHCNGSAPRPCQGRFVDFNGLTEPGLYKWSVQWFGWSAGEAPWSTPRYFRVVRVGGIQFGSPQNDYAYSVAVDEITGRVYVGGSTQGDMPGGGGSFGRTDGFLSAFDTSLRLLWTVQIGGSDYDQVRDIALDPSSGAVYVSGEIVAEGRRRGFVARHDGYSGEREWMVQWSELTPSSVCFSPTPDGGALFVVGVSIASFVEERPYLMRLDPGHGNERWIHRFADGIYMQDVACNEAAAYVTGSQLRGGARHDVFVASFDPVTGREQWSMTFGSDRTDWGHSVAVDPANERIFVAGRSWGHIAGRFGWRVPHGSAMNGFVAGVRADTGEITWIRSLVTRGWDALLGLTVDPTGARVYATGYVGGTLPGTTEFGGSDAIVMAYDAAGGDSIWTHRTGGRSRDSAEGLAVTSHGVLFVTGWTESRMFGRIAQTRTDAFLFSLADPFGQGPNVLPNPYPTTER